jgi:protein gp138
VASNPTMGFIDLPTRLREAVEQWNRTRWQLLCDLRVAIPAVVVSFNSTTQCVRVQPAIQENVLVNSVPTPTSLPILGGDAGQEDIPILVPRGGGFSITLPIQPGDECLLVFSDMQIDSWWQSGGTENVQSYRRRHNLSDAIAVFGLWSQPRVLSNYATSSLQIRSDDGKRLIEITESAINITVTDSSPVTISTQGGKVTIESTSEIDVTAPTVKISGNTELDLSGAAVKLGDSGATKHLAFIEDVETVFNAHIHTGGTISGDTGAPTTTLSSSNGTTKTVAD